MKAAGTKVLDLDWVESLRKDFLALLKNIPHVKTYKDYVKLQRGFVVYANRFSDLFFEHFLNTLVKNKESEGASWAGYANRKLRSPGWSFYISLSVPGGYPDEYKSEDQIVAKFQAEAPKWKERVMRAARPFWAAMREFLEWYRAEKAAPGPAVPVPENLSLRLEGFQVIMRGFSGSAWDEEALAKIKEGLKGYNQRASAVAPILLKKQLPIILEFKASLDKGGEYNHDGTITFYASSAARGSKWVTHALAHEMGHHLWRAYLGRDAQEFWEQTIYGDYGDLDLRTLLAKWPEGAWAFEMSKDMPDDPVLALQVEAFAQSRKELQQKEDYEALLANGIKTLKVPMHPITGYASKNPEEAFCETLGLLVAYGPRALHEKVRFWLQTAIPGAIRVASMPSLVVARYLEAFEIG